MPMVKRVAILQSNYLPWKGYFDLIHDVDLFVFYDDVQYTKNDWRNRNKIKTPNGLTWLTVPAGTDLDRLVCDVQLTDTRWAQKHWKSLQQSYSSAPHFKRYEAFFKDVYLGRRWDNLSELNQYLIKAIAGERLGIRTRFVDSRAYPAQGKKLDRLMDLIAKVGAQVYVSGPAGKSYIEADRFAQLGVELVYKSYEGYPPYPQRYPPFEHAVSIVDLLFNTGPDAPSYIWGWREAPLRDQT
jgi:WbqC-like protein family